MSPNLEHIRAYGNDNGVADLFKRGISYLCEPVLKNPFHWYLKSNYDRIVVSSEELKWRYATDLQTLEENLAGLHPRLNHELAPLQKDGSITHEYDPRFAFKQPFVAEIPDVTIAGRDAMGYTADGKVLAEPTYSLTETFTDRVGNRLYESMVRSPLSIALPVIRGAELPAEREYDNAAILYFRWYNYYHWMVEQLPKIRGIRRYERNNNANIRLVVPSDPPAFVHESLDLLGYDDSDYVEWDKTNTRVSSLIVPSYPDPAPQSLRWVRERMIRSASNPGTVDDRRIVYISRQESSRRSVSNFTEIKQILDQYGIEVVHCENLNLEEEIQLFSTVDGIVGPHGAGLTAMLWANDIFVVELFNSVVVPPYYVIAHVLGHEYTALSGTPVEDDVCDKDYNRNFDVDLKEFESTIEKLVGDIR